MIKTVSLTVSLELAKKMKELGFTQDTCEISFFYDEGDLVYITPGLEGFTYSEWYAAPTAEEVLEQLPMNVEGYYRLHTLKTKIGWDVFYKPNDSSVECLVIRMGETLAEAAGKMWVYLKEQKLI